MPKPCPSSRLKHMPMGGSVLVLPSFRHTENVPMIGHRRNHHAHASVRRLRDRSLFGCSRFGHASAHPSRWIRHSSSLCFGVSAFRQSSAVLLVAAPVQLQACTLSGFAGDVRFASLKLLTPRTFLTKRSIVHVIVKCNRNRYRKTDTIRACLGPFRSSARVRECQQLQAARILLEVLAA